MLRLTDWQGLLGALLRRTLKQKPGSETECLVQQVLSSLGSGGRTEQQGTLVCAVFGPLGEFSEWLQSKSKGMIKYIHSV